jgi:hypothetical protein
MNSWQILLVALALLAGLTYPFWGTLLKAAIGRGFERWARRLARRRAMNQVTSYRRALQIDADAATTAALVEQVKATRRTSTVGPGVWHIEGTDAQFPIVVGARTSGTGTLLVVTTPAFDDGALVVGPLWTRLHRAVAERAAEHGIVTRLVDDVDVPGVAAAL